MVESLLGAASALEARGWRGDKQVFLLFTSDRIIVVRKGLLADVAGSGFGFAIGGLALGLALSVGDSSSQKAEKQAIRKEHFDELIKKHKGSYSIDYAMIENADMKKALLANWLEIQTKDDKYRFKGFWMDKKHEGFLNYEGIAELLKSQIPNKLNFIS